MTVAHPASKNTTMTPKRNSTKTTHVRILTSQGNVLPQSNNEATLKHIITTANTIFSKLIAQILFPMGKEKKSHQANTRENFLIFNEEMQ
jgi:hypothetical protein